MVETQPQLHPLSERLVGTAAGYVHALSEYGLQHPDDMTLDNFNNDEFINAMISPERASADLKTSLLKLRVYALHPKLINYPKIRAKWEIADSFLKDHHNALYSWKSEAIFYGSMIFGNPEKADLNLQIVSQINAIPFSLQNKLINDINHRLSGTGSKLSFISVNDWKKHIADESGYSDPEKAWGLFQETKDIAPVLYGIPYGILKPDFLDPIRRNIMTLARQYPVTGAQLSYTIDFALDRVLTRRNVR